MIDKSINFLVRLGERNSTGVETNEQGCNEGGKGGEDDEQQWR